MKVKRFIRYSARGVLNSYSQVFFSDNPVFAIILLLVSFADIFAGLAGIVAVLSTNLCAVLIGFDRNNVSKGIYGFNSLLVGLSLGIYFTPSLVLLVLVILAAMLALFITVSLKGVIGKYGLPFLSMPFVLGAWIMTLATRNMEFLGISERGIFTMNELFSIGGHHLVNLYDWWNNIGIWRPLKIYFISLGAIFFQYNVLSGMIIALGLLYYSRISFSLSLLGFFTAYAFYNFVGADISEINYSYIGFNYILTSIAIGGFFIIPSYLSYLWSLLLVPVVALISISLYSLFSAAALPVYALPFNLIVLLFLYSLKFRVSSSVKLTEVIIQQNSPEKNLYSFENDMERFRHDKVPVRLPFFGIWTVAQGYDGKITHLGSWKHALDFVILDKDGKQFKGSGDLPEDYYCFNKPVLSPSDGFIESVIDDVEDNVIGKANIRDNWGNTVIIRHNNQLYSSLSHLRKGSVNVKPGERVKQGDMIGRCGNSGRSSFPHLHFQIQEHPFIGSQTIEYPLSYYIENHDNNFELRNFSIPVSGDSISNIITSDLLKGAFDLIPGKTLCMEQTREGSIEKFRWEINTNEYNIPYISCLSSSSKAYFSNDGSLFLFRHFEGRKETLLYYFYLALFRVQLGFYGNMVLKDRFPLNLILKNPWLFIQDFIAPFFKFLRSEYRLRYDYIDNEVSPAVIRLESSCQNYFGIKKLSELKFEITINESGIYSFRLKSKNKSFSATKCQEY